MKIWNVEVPIAGYVSVEVEADDYNEAKQKGWQKVNKFENEELLENIQELETYSRLVEGNVCYVYHNKIDAECIDDIDN